MMLDDALLQPRAVMGYAAGTG